jgi:thioredoxin 1
MVLGLVSGLAFISSPACTERPVTSQAPPQSVIAYNPSLPLLIEYGRGACPWCQKQKPIIEELATQYRSRINVGAISVDEQAELAQRAGVSGLPTIIIYRPGGQEAYRHMGFWPKDDIVAKLHQLGMV